MSKISRIKLLWKGTDFKHLYVYVDIVLAFSTKGEKYFPFWLRCDSFNLIAKADRHEYVNKDEFPKSYCDAEALVMKSLPEPIRQGFITAKAVRLVDVCAYEFDMVQFGLIEDLAIEDYITSHSLKNCLLNRLKQVHNKRYKGRNKSRTFGFWFVASR